MAEQNANRYDGAKRRRKMNTGPSETEQAGMHDMASMVAAAKKKLTGGKKQKQKPQENGVMQPQSNKHSSESAYETENKNNRPRPPKKRNNNSRPQNGQSAPEKAGAKNGEILTADGSWAPRRYSSGKTARRMGKASGEKLRIIPLGGLGEIGKNVTMYDCGNDAFLVDCGMTFPDESMPGVDLVLPDMTYIVENRSRIRGIAVTHGHEDHIGAIPYLLKQFNVPIYATRLTLGLIEGKLKEHGLLNKADLKVVHPGDVVDFGSMQVEFINVNHSVPGACAMAIHTPLGVIIQTGDFKFDFTPIRGEIIDLARFGELGSRGVLALLSDSTNAERPGFTPSERVVGESLDKLFAAQRDKRILIATFSSNVHRLQQIIESAVKYKRKVAVSGRSMENVVSKALEIGYLDVPSGVLVDIDAISKYPPEKVVIITTGSQGEPMSALTRMATGEHRKVIVTEHDCIILSATPIPGNERLVTKVINDLLKLGATVVYGPTHNIHVSGHACQNELKTILALTKPKFFIPVHGEQKQLRRHAELAVSMGISKANILIAENGNVIELDGNTMRLTGTVPAGKVLVDGSGIGDVGNVVLRDRKHLAQDGLIVVVATIDGESGQIISGPDIVSRGFVYVRESEEMMAQTRAIARECIEKCIRNNTREWGVIKQCIRDDISHYIWQKTKRTPMILPVVQEVRR